MKEFEPEGAAEIRKQIELAGSSGLSSKELRVTGSSAAAQSRRRLVNALLQSGEVVEFRLGRERRFVSRGEEHSFRAEQVRAVRERILQKAIPGQPKLYSVRRLLKGDLLGRKAYDFAVESAWRELVAEHKIIVVQYGNAKLFLHEASLPGSDARQQEPNSVVAPEALLSAFDAISRRTRMPSVYVAELVNAVGGEPGAALAVLEKMARDGRAVAYRGDPSLAPTAMRSPCLVIAGVEYLMLTLRP